MGKVLFFCLTWLFYFLHFLIFLIKFILWLRSLYKQKASKGHGGSRGSLFWEGRIGSCFITGVNFFLPCHPTQTWSPWSRQPRNPVDKACCQPKDQKHTNCSPLPKCWGKSGPLHPRILPHREALKPSHGVSRNHPGSQDLHPHLQHQALLLLPEPPPTRNPCTTTKSCPTCHN